MSHHASGPDFGFPRGDARLDMTDLYAFPKPGDPAKSILILNVHMSFGVNPPGPTTTEPFAPGALYEIKIDTDAVPGYASMDLYRRVVVAVLLPCLFFGLPSDRDKRKLRLRVIALCLLVFLSSGTIGCSGKYPSSTPPGTYSIMINGHGESTSLDRTTTLTLIVTPKESQ